MLAAAGQAFRDIFSPSFRIILFKCLGFTIALLVLLIIAAEWSFAHFITLPNWAEKTIEWLGGFALIATSVFLIPPVTSLIAGLYLDDIAAEVERTYYPADAPGHELGTGTAIAMSLRFFLVILAVNLLALLLLLIPGVNLIAFYVGNGYLLGREYFEMVAMRHLPPEAARNLRKANRVTVLLSGFVIAGLASVPILNLTTPLFATAFMVHMFKGLTRGGAG
jgi:CysZ protein